MSKETNSKEADSSRNPRGFDEDYYDRQVPAVTVTLTFSRPWPISHGAACPASSVPSTPMAALTPNLNARAQSEQRSYASGKKKNNAENDDRKRRCLFVASLVHHILRNIGVLGSVIRGAATAASETELLLWREAPRTRTTAVPRSHDTKRPRRQLPPSPYPMHATKHSTGACKLDTPQRIKNTHSKMFGRAIDNRARHGTVWAQSTGQHTHGEFAK